MQLLWSRRKEERGIKIDNTFFFPIYSLLQLFTLFPLLHLRSALSAFKKWKEILTIFWYSFIRTLSSLLWVSGKAPVLSIALQFPLQYVSWGDKTFPLSSSVLKGNLQSDRLIPCLGLEDARSLLPRSCKKVALANS